MSLEPIYGDLERYFNNPDARPQILDSLWQDFGRTGAVMVLDMGGFSSTTKERGIVFYLALIARMQKIVEPLFHKHQGKVIKFEADNCFAVFDDVHHAVAAAFAIKDQVQTVNQSTPEEFDLVLKFGIDFGRFLSIHGDFWGDPINCASKLGEDLAMGGEILVSARAIKRLKDSRETPEIEEFNISQIVIEAGRF